MVKTLILVRHGKAQRAGTGVPDELRALTDAGRAALAAPNGFPRTFSLVGASNRTRATIWASPAVRAQQTAQEVTAALGNRRAIIPMECLWEQDEQAFLRALAGEESDLLIAVGHIPFMNRMAESLCGASLSFRPGGAAAIALDGDGAGELL